MTILVFSDTDCVPCKQLKQALKDVQTRYGLSWTEITATQGNQRRFEQFGVRAVPTLLILDEVGAEIGRFTGARTASAIEQFLRDAGVII